MDLDIELLNVVKHCDMDYAGNLSDLKNKLDGFSMREIKKICSYVLEEMPHHTEVYSITRDVNQGHVNIYFRGGHAIMTR